MNQFRPETKSLIAPAIFAVLFSTVLRFSNHPAWDWLAAIFALMIPVSIYSILAQSRAKGETEKYNAYALFADKIAVDKIPMDRFHALGIKFPWIDIDISQFEPEERLGGTSVPKDFFIKFLKNSNSSHVWAYRNLKKAKEIEWWVEIIELLSRYGYIHKDAAGNHSHSWIGKYHLKLYQAFIKSDAVNLNKTY